MRYEIPVRKTQMIRDADLKPKVRSARSDGVSVIPEPDANERRQKHE